MNILVWVVQAVLAALYVAGGAYKAFSFEEVAKQLTALPHVGWRALGIFEMAGGALMILPAATRWMPALTPAASAALAVETFALAALYATYSLNVSASNPLVWAAVMGTLAAFVAYGRYALVPVA